MGDMKEARAMLGKYAQKIYSHYQRWPTHIAFHPRNHHHLKEFCNDYGAEVMIGLKAPFGSFWLGFGRGDDPVKKLPDFCKRPGFKDEEVRVAWQRRKHRKGTSAKDKGAKRTSKAGKALNLQRYEERYAWVEETTQETRPDIKLRRGKVSESWYGLLSKDYMTSSGIALTGEHILRDVEPSGASRFLIVDGNTKHVIPDSHVVSYGKATDHVVECAKNMDRLPDFVFLLETLEGMFYGLDELAELDNVTSDDTEELTEFVLANYAAYSSKQADMAIHNGRQLGSLIPTKQRR